VLTCSPVSCCGCNFVSRGRDRGSCESADNADWMAEKKEHRMAVLRSVIRKRHHHGCHQDKVLPRHLLRWPGRRV
jgi:hypothetical protein